MRVGTGNAAVSSLLMTNVSRVSVHQGYVRFAPDELDYDVALLTLATPLDLSGVDAEGAAVRERGPR